MANDYRDRNRNRNRDLDRDDSRWQTDNNRGMFGYECEGYMRGEDRDEYGAERWSSDRDRSGNASFGFGERDFGRDRDFDRDRSDWSRNASNLEDVSRDRMQAERDRNRMPDRFDSGTHSSYDDRSGGFGGGSYQGGEGMDRGRGMGGGNYGSSYGNRSMGSDRGRTERDDMSWRGGDRDYTRGEFGDADWNRGRSQERSLGRGMMGGENIGMDRDIHRGGAAWDDRGYSANRGMERDSWDTDRNRGEHRGFMDKVRDSFRGRGPKGYQRSDERIREDVCEMLERDHHVDASDIEVSVSGATVTLTGVVPDRSMKRRAEDLAEAATGVRDVQNSIRVDHSRGSHRGDRDDTEMASGVLGLTNTENYEEGGTHTPGTNRNSGGARRTGSIAGIGSLPATTGQTGFTTTPMTNPGAVTTGANSQETRSSNSGMTSGKSTAADRARKKR